ncbi:MAG TPA: hypothetical protein DCL35_07555 [Candidatus Omnitrophica bacterium]|nr:hypothetical protein [Candidatus Omnitrophota bacterium]
MASWLRFKIWEKIYYSKYVRYIWAVFVRLFSLSEYTAIKRYIAAGSGGFPKKNVIALSCGSAIFEHIFEHIKEIFSALKSHPSFTPLLVTSVKFSRSARKAKTFSDLEAKYGLTYGKNLFSYAWLSKVGPSVYIESQPTPYADFCKKTAKILYAHGLANLGFSKDFSLIRYISKYDYLFLTGPLQKRAMLEAHDAYGGRLPEMVEIGFLRGDRLLAKVKDCDKRALLAVMGLDDRFTILFAPTWGEFSATREWIDKVVDAALKLDVNILIRLHPLLLGGITGWETANIDWNARLEQIARRYKRVYIAREDDIDNYLLASDICITDASSVGMEFMLLGRPTLFLPAPNFFKIYGKERPIKWVMDGLEVSTYEELEERLKECLEGRGRVKSYPLDKMVYNPGRTIDAMVTFLERLTVK